MQKNIFIFKGSRSEDYKAFRERVFLLTDQILEKYQPQTLKVSLTTKKPPALSIIPFKKDKAAAISVTGLSQEGVDLLEKSGGFTGGYLVEEALPVTYEKTWDDNVETPGPCLLTLFQRKPGIDWDTFIDRWHNGHTPLSLRLHPLWHYNRNVVTGTLTGDSYGYEGIVEEHFKTARELLNPLIFFGPPLKVLYHMYLVLKDTRGFIDMKRIETYLAAEYHIKSK